MKELFQESLYGIAMNATMNGNGKELRMIPSTYYRSLLLPNEQAEYRRIVSSLLRFHERVQIGINANDTEVIRRVVNAVHRDHPELIHVDFWHFNVQSNIMMLGSTIQFHFLLDQETYHSVSETIRRKVNVVQSKALNEPSLQKRYYILMDEIASSTSYKNTNSAFWDHTAAGPILLHSSVCEGIAKLFLLLCQRLDLPCALITGTLNGEAHAWNMVEIKGKRRYVDVTALLRSIPFYKHTLFQSRLFMSRNEMQRKGYAW